MTKNQFENPQPVELYQEYMRRGRKRMDILQYVEACDQRPNLCRLPDGLKNVWYRSPVHGKVKLSVRRLAYVHKTGELPAPQPTCGVNSCINPHHNVPDGRPPLERGTPTEGQRDIMYFTFGQDHMTSYPFPKAGRLADFWVTVDLPASHFEHHRAVFMREFTEKHCPRPTQFALEYEAADFKPEYFPGGELCRITEGGVQ